MKKILIPEDIPCDNKGEAALFYGMLESLKPLGPVEMNLFSLHPAKDRKDYGEAAKIIDSRGVTPAHIVDGVGSIGKKALNYLVFIFKISVFLLLCKIMGRFALNLMRRPLWSACLDADLILMSHDSFFSPIYHGALLLFFKLLRKPTAIYAATIIPPSRAASKFKSDIARWMTREGLRQAELITLREEQSAEYLSELGLSETQQTDVCADLAFLMPPVSKSRIREIAVYEGLDKKAGPLVGMAVSQRKMDFAFPEISSSSEKHAKALEQMVRVADHVTGVLKASVVFVPHSIGPTSKLDDRIPAQHIFEKARQPDQIIVIRNEYTSQELKGMAGIFDATLGMRLHFTIDALCMGVPSVLITHEGDFRCHGIMGDMLGLHEYLYNVESIDAEVLIAKMEKLWNNRVSIQKQIRSGVPALKKQAERNGILAHAMLSRFPLNNN